MSEILSYHQATKHSPRSVAMSVHRLDWSNKPLPFKIYRGLESIEPPADILRLCRLSNGVLRWRQYGGETYGFRAAACTGALYHIELHLATAERDDLPAGLYHYGAHDDRLHVLRRGDVRAAIQAAAGGRPAIQDAPLVFLLSSTFWRNAWKYQARAYRHTYWDGGAVVANLLAVLAADGLPASVVMGFADEELNRLLGLDGVREAVAAIVVVGDDAPSPPALEQLPPISSQTEPLSPREVAYPEIEVAHLTSSLTTVEVSAWHARAGGATHEVPQPVTRDRPIDEVIGRRRSARSFADRQISRAQLDALLEAALQPIPGDSFSPLPVEPFLIINSVEDVASGAYHANLKPIRLGDFRQQAAELALWQELAADAAVNVYFLADLPALVERLGERGYRIAQLTGGICGERLELSATDLGVGATGLTFFDDAVTEFFEPASARRQVMYLAAAGSR